MNGKDKPYRFVDTHAGAGGYSLQGRYAQKKGEYLDGIARLWNATTCPSRWPTTWSARARVQPGGALEQYPGSPAFARMVMRPGDPLCLFELHPTEHRILESHLGGQRNVDVRHADGFDGLKSQLPPPTRRGAVLIDPSYEGHGDYARVVEITLRDALARFAEGVYMVWYPQVQKVEAASCRAGWRRSRLGLAARAADGGARRRQGASGPPAAACSSSTRPTRCTTRWPACCPGW